MRELEDTTPMPTAMALHLVVVEPRGLREMANRLEFAAKGAVEGQSIICALTQTIHVIYHPKKESDGSTQTIKATEECYDESKKSPR
jgi:hypothetical protein